MATTFNDALQEFNIGASSTTNVDGGNIVIPEGSETLSDLIKLNYDFKETPLLPNDKSYNIYIWNNNTDGEIRFYTKDAKNNNNFNQNTFSGTYNEPRLEYNTKIGKDGKLYLWHSYNILLPTKLSGWYNPMDDIYGLSFAQQNADIIIAANSASIILTNTNVSTLAGRVLTAEEAIVSLGTLLASTATKLDDVKSITYGIWDYLNLDVNEEVATRIRQYQQTLGIYRVNSAAFSSTEQIARIQASSALSSYRINIANNFSTAIGIAAFTAGVLGGIKYVSDAQQKDNYTTELLRISDTLVKRQISSANNIINHTCITKTSGDAGFPLTLREFFVPIQKNAVLIININNLGVANVILVEQIGDTLFNVNETITINRTLLNGSAGNLILNVSSLGTLKEWTELKATYLQNKITKIDTKNRRKTNTIGHDDVNPNHFTSVNTIYTDNDGIITEDITYKSLEINPNYKVPTCIQADEATNSATAAVATKLQTPRKIANVNFDGSVDIDVSYINITNKPTSFTTNIGIGTTAHATYKLDVLGDVNIPTGSTYKINGVSIPTSLPVNQLWDYIGTETSTKGKYTMDKVGIGGFASDAYDLKLENSMTATNYHVGGSAIFKPIEKTILPARLDMTGVPLDVNKIYERFNTTNFAIIDNLVDLPPSYSFNITGYDPQNLYNPTAERRLKGKMSASYDDRNGVHKLVSTDTSITYNTAVLSYKVGDKITFRNTADPSLDYFLFSGFKYFMKTYLYKRPSNVLFDANINDGNTTIVFEWESNEYAAYNVYPKVYDRRTSPNKEYPFSTPMSLIVEAGFNYYLLRLFYEGGVSGNTLIVVGTFYGDDYNDFNRAYGAGQTFKLLSGATAVASDYLPKTYTPPQLPVASLGQLGGVKPRRGMAIDATTGDTDIIPLSSDLITNMNTSHFTNNTATNKIDISSSYVAPNATKLATQRTIAGVNFDGSGNIDIPYSGLTGKPDLFDGVYSSLTGKPSLFDGVYSSLTGKPSLFDGVYSSLSGKPNLFSGSYVDLSNKLTAGNGLTISAATPPVITPNFTAGTGIAINTAVNPITIGVSGLTAALIPDLATSKITSGTFADSFIPSLATSKITSGTFADSFIPSLAIAKISGLQGALDAKQATLTAGTNISIVGTTISASATFAPTSTNMIGIFNPNDFVNNTGTSKIDLSNNTSNYVARINTELGGRVDNTSNYVSRINTELTTSIGTKQAILTAGTNISIVGTTISASSTFTPTSTNMISIFNSAQFENVSSLIQIKSTFKPAGAVLADTATALATSRNIAGTAFNGTADIAIDYFALYNKPITIPPTTTNLLTASGYSFSIAGYTAVGTTAIATNVLQVGAGGRLRISNGTTDYTLIGTLDADGATNTSIVISGTTRSTNAGNIQYLATASGGSHIFYTASTTTRMTISSSGVNVNDNFAVVGRVGIATAPHATYKLDVLGDINISGAYRVGGVALANSWSAGSTATNIYYALGNVGIGTSTTSDVDDNTAFAIPTATLFVKGGATTGGTCDVVIRGGVAGQNGGKARLWLAADASHSSYIQSEHTNSGNTYLSFGTANGNALPAERMKIASDGTSFVSVNVWHSSMEGLARIYYAPSSTTYLRGHGTTPIIFRNGADTEMMWIDSNGFTTIGYLTQGAFPTGIKLNVYGSDSNGWAAAFKHPNNSQGIAIVYDGISAMGTAANQDVWVRPRGTGIFQVGSSTYSTTINGGYLGTGGAGSGTYTWGNICAKFNGSAWMTGSVIASSDSRIKEDIQDINDDDALNKLLAIEPKTYKYIDKIAKGDKKVYGFIAQQVREVIPEATTIEKSYIPNIMIIGEFNDYIITLPSQPTKVIIKVNDNIKCIDDNGNVILVKVDEVIDEITFKIKAIDDMKPLEYTHDKIFIHGTEVDDFHTLSKEYIFTLNVCATQELHRRMEAQNVIIKSQDERIKSQNERIKELEAKVERLLNYISA